MKRLILLFTLICTLSLTALAADPVYKLATWDLSGELAKLTEEQKTFKSASLYMGRSYIYFPNGIQITQGEKFLVTKDGTYYKQYNGQKLSKNTWTNIRYEGSGGNIDIEFAETFTCYYIFLGGDSNNALDLFFCTEKIAPVLFTWVGGAFHELADKAFKPVNDFTLHMLEIPEGAEINSSVQDFLISCMAVEGGLEEHSTLYKSTTGLENSNTWHDLKIKDNFAPNIKLNAGKKYYKILFAYDTKKIYASTIPLAITPKAPTAKWNADNKIELELELPADITSVSKKFISKATITRTDAAQATQTYEIAKADLDDKPSVTYVDVNTDLTAAANYTYTVVYEYIDYEGSTEILTTNPSEQFVVNTNTEASFKIFLGSNSNEELGNNIFVGFGAEWMPATTFSNLAPTYTLSYSTDDATWTDIADVNPSNENGVMKQVVYGVPNNAKIRIATTYGETAFTGTNIKTHTFDYSEILTAPTTFNAKDLKRYGNDTDKNVAYSATISWENEALNPVSSWVVDYADANVTPIVYTNFSNDWAYNGVQNLNSTGISYTGDKYVAKIKYSIKANYSFGNTVQTTIADEDYARSTDVEIKASEALTADVDFDIEVSTGVEDATNNIVAIYPNPTTGTLVINNTTPIEKISIFNIAGSCVKDINGSNDTSATIDIEDLAQGTYFVKVNSSVTKVIKK